MALLQIKQGENWVDVPEPDDMPWGLNDISSEKAGRTEDALMHKKRIAQKVKLSLKWKYPTAELAHTILVMFNPEYVLIRYYDPLFCSSVNGLREKEFYVGDRSAMLKRWDSKEKRYDELSFDIIER